MKITGASVTLLPRAPGAAHGTELPGLDGGRGYLLELHTDAGLTGIAIGRRDTRRPIAALLQDLLRGEDPGAAPALYQRMKQRPRPARNTLQYEAEALADIALWDLKAKANGESLWKTLGGSRPQANAVLSWTANLIGAEPGSRFSEVVREFGFRQAMVRPARSADADRRQLGAAQRALARGSMEPELAIDAADIWSPNQALRRIRALERRFDVSWVALAAPPGDARGLRRVSDAVRAAVCAGRGLSFPGDFTPHLRHRSIDLVQIDINVNGITGAMQLADAAFAFELPVMLCAAPGNIQAHLAGAMPYVMNAEVTTPRLPPDSPCRTDIRIEYGRVVAGDAPGNGITVELAALPFAPRRHR